MDVAAKLADAQIQRVAIVDDDLSYCVTRADLEIVDAAAAAVLNDPMDPDRDAYWQLLVGDGRHPEAQIRFLMDVRFIEIDHQRGLWP